MVDVIGASRPVSAPQIGASMADDDGGLCRMDAAISEGVSVGVDRFAAAFGGVFSLVHAGEHRGKSVGDSTVGWRHRAGIVVDAGVSDLSVADADVQQRELLFVERDDAWRGLAG